MEIKWKLRQPSTIDQFRHSSMTYESESIPQLAMQILQSRGISEEDRILKWLTPKLSELRDPYLLDQMKKAALRIVDAKKRAEKIAIYGDFDLDGTSGIALLGKAFEKLGMSNFILYQPSRLTEGYGFHVEAVRKFKAQGVSLIVTVDVGITAIAAAQECKNLGIDLIITDHHLAQDELPLCLALVNPNVGEDRKANLGHLCGAGVAFYLAWALKREAVLAGLAQEKDLDLKDLLDCFVIGTLTDMVPIIDENRVLIKHGLVKLAATQRPGLRVLLQELGLWGRPLNGSDVAIRFAPKLNALSRMELGIRPLDIFLVQDEKKAEELIVGVLNNNNMRVNLQAEAESIAVELGKNQEDQNFIFICHENFHKGVVGLIATKLSQVFNKPTFIGSLAEDGVVVGSARAPQGKPVNLVKALETAGVHFLRFGGHAMAAGFEFEIAKLELIKSRLINYFSQDLEKEDLGIEILYDAEAHLNELSPQFMGWLDRIGPFGHSFDAPLFLIRDLEITSLKTLKGGHRRLNIRTQNRDLVVSQSFERKNSEQQEALLFSPSPNQEELLDKNLKSRVDVLAELQWNYFQGRKRVQILIKEIRATQ